MKIFTVIFAIFFLEILPKFSDFVNSYDNIGNIPSKSIRLQPIFILKKKLKLIKNKIFSIKKNEKFR